MWQVTAARKDGTIEVQKFKDEVAALYFKGMIETNMQKENSIYTGVQAEELVICTWKDPKEDMPKAGKNVPAIMIGIASGKKTMRVLCVDENKKWHAEAGYEVPGENVLSWLDIPDLA